MRGAAIQCNGIASCSALTRWWSWNGWLNTLTKRAVCYASRAFHATMPERDDDHVRRRQRRRRATVAFLR